ncbi:MAG: HEAT repeat domain-containing protein [Spirochaetaceae bacterium]|jgi:HEAT repeat protein|nr:HEAT repeat domain-containing protein [Spirochaetaceae bacterium]
MKHLLYTIILFFFCTLYVFPANTSSSTKSSGSAQKSAAATPPEAEAAAENPPTQAKTGSTAVASGAPAQKVSSLEEQYRATIQYGTETEIATLIQTLKREQLYYLDTDLIALTQKTKNQAILIGVWSFFGERAKSGLEEKALSVIDSWDTEKIEVVTAAIDYLGQVKALEAIESLETLIDNEERSFMNGAFKALGRIAAAGNADQIAQFLIDYYTNRNPAEDLKRDIIIAVGETGLSDGIALLSTIATNPDERVVLRTAALESLTKLGEGLDAIMASVNASDPSIRSTAIAALTAFSGQEVETAILESFRDSYYKTRMAAAKVAGERKLNAAVPYLQYRAERDDVPAVKDEAIKALGIIGNSEALAVLESLFIERKTTDRVRLLSAEMLIKNSADTYVERLIFELDEAKKANLTALYNGFLKVLGMAKTDKLEGLTRRFLRAGGIVEKSLALDMIANNGFSALSDEVRLLTSDKNSGLAKKAQNTLETLVGIL